MTNINGGVILNGIPFSVTQAGETTSGTIKIIVDNIQFDEDSDDWAGCDLKFAIVIGDTEYSIFDNTVSFA